MQGHDPDLLGLRAPGVSDPNQIDVMFYDVPRMVAYNFFQQVGAGVHTVDILFAGCCSASTGFGQGLVNTAVLTLCLFRKFFPSAWALLRRGDRPVAPPWTGEIFMKQTSSHSK